MDKKMPVDNNSSHPIDLDSLQIEELDKLIDNLKKEIVFPQRKMSERVVPTEVEHR